MDYDKFVYVTIEFISLHPISIPLTKQPDPKFTLKLVTKAIERIRCSKGVIEVYMTEDMIVPVTMELFLRAIGIPPNSEGSVVVEPTAATEFQGFLNQIGIIFIN